MILLVDRGRFSFLAISLLSLKILFDDLYTLSLIFNKYDWLLTCISISSSNVTLLPIMLIANLIHLILVFTAHTSILALRWINLQRKMSPSSLSRRPVFRLSNVLSFLMLYRCLVDDLFGQKVVLLDVGQEWVQIFLFRLLMLTNRLGILPFAAIETLSSRLPAPRGCPHVVCSCQGPSWLLGMGSIILFIGIRVSMAFQMILLLFVRAIILGQWTFLISLGFAILHLFLLWIRLRLLP